MATEVSLHQVRPRPPTAYFLCGEGVVRTFGAQQWKLTPQMSFFSIGVFSLSPQSH